MKMKQKQMSGQKKDRIFIIVMAIIIANLFYTLIQVVPYLITTNPRDINAWALCIADIMGIIGGLWLVREERRRRQIGKEKEAEEAEERDFIGKNI